MSYNHTMQRINQIACGVQKNTEAHGVYIPPTLLQNRPFIAAIDNIDAKVDTPDDLPQKNGRELTTGNRQDRHLSCI